MKKIAIIGAGIAGLSAGIYARKAGFEVEIFESHSLPGGLCTAWERQGFVFDGCIHYLMGVDPESAFYRLWDDIGALSGRQFVFPKALASSTDRSGRTATLYCDPDELEEHLCSFAPSDQNHSRKFCNLIRSIQRAPVPIEKAPELMGAIDIAKIIWASRHVAKESSFCFKTSITQFAKGFRDPLLGQLLESTMDPRSPLFNLVATLGDLSRKYAGYPVGGSLPFVRSIESNLSSLGGKIYYKKRVQRLVVHSGRVTGLELSDGTQVDSDYVVAASDLRTILDSLAPMGLRSPVHERLFSEAKISAPCVQVSFGLNRRYDQDIYSVSRNLELEEPLSCAGERIGWLALQDDYHDQGLSPRGCSIVKSLLPTDFKSWSRLSRDNNEYKEAKESLAQSVINALGRSFPGFAKDVTAIDVATPITYQRYTGNYQGAYMTWIGDTQRKIIPKMIPGLDNLLLAGMWVAAPGGLPVALKSARDVIQILCKKERIAFGR